jgi:glycosyltransferase involved in cell wall biosynthesis
MSFALFFADDSPEAEMTYRQSNKSALLPPPAGRLLSEQDAAGLADAAEMTPPLVSVIIPCYNSARYLAETIASALGQTYPRIEVIVIDDGSTDDTPRIARSFPVTYLYQANCGVSAARNKGIFRSRGKYVLFLDHDDRLLPEAVATGVRLLEEHPECAVAVGEHRYIGADGTELGYSNKRAAGRDHYLMLLEGNFVETPCSALHRRSSFFVTGVFDESVQGAEDHELYLRTARRSAFIGHDATVSEYRLHDCNTSRNAELMLSVSHRVIQMEVPYLQGGGVAKLRSHRRGMRFVERHFGGQLTRELIRDGRLMKPENRRKLKLLRRHYAVGFAAVVLSKLMPVSLLNGLLALRARHTKRGRRGESLSCEVQNRATVTVKPL